MASKETTLELAREDPQKEVVVSEDYPCETCGCPEKILIYYDHLPTDRKCPSCRSVW